MQKLPPEKNKKNEKPHVDDLGDEWKRLGWVEVEYGIPSTTLYGAADRDAFPCFHANELRGAKQAYLKVGDEFEKYIESYNPRKRQKKQGAGSIEDLVNKIEDHLDQVRILMNNLKDRSNRFQELEDLIENISDS